MNNVTKTTKLDLDLIKPYYKYYFIMILCPIFITIQNKSLVAGVVFAMTMASMTSNYTFTVAEKNDLNRLYGLLPVSKRDLLNGRYASTAIIGIILLIVSTIFNIGVLTVCKAPLVLDEITYGISLGLIMFFFFTAIQLPAYYKFGSIKGRMYSFLPFLGIFLVSFIADKVIPASTSANWLVEPIVNNPPLALVLSILLCIIFYGISIGVSTAIYNNKEM